jgi:predicted nucleic acid-binding protein
MVRTDDIVAVSDARPVIHLDELKSLDLLLDVGTIWVPSQVWSEIVAHRPNLVPAHVPGLQVSSVIPSPSPELRTLAKSLSLHQGERAALILMQAKSAQFFLCDDSAARLAAESLGFQVHGTVGILVRAIRRRLRSRDEVLSLLAELPNRSSLHLARDLLAKVIDVVRQG